MRGFELLRARSKTVGWVGGYNSIEEGWNMRSSTRARVNLTRRLRLGTGSAVFQRNPSLWDVANPIYSFYTVCINQMGLSKDHVCYRITTAHIKQCLPPRPYFSNSCNLGARSFLVGGGSSGRAISHCFSSGLWLPLLQLERGPAIKSCASAAFWPFSYVMERRKNWGWLG